MANIVSDYSAVADGAYEQLTLTISNGGTSLTRASGSWPANIAGKAISIGGATQFDAPFLPVGAGVLTVSSRTNNSTIVLSAAAPAALSSASRLVCYGTNNATPFANFTADNQGATVSLTISAGVYFVSYANPIFDGISNLTVNATGATIVGGIVNFQVTGQIQDNTHHALTQTSNEGALSVTLATAAEDALFTPGRFAMMTGLDIYGIGQPGNNYYFEYPIISSASSGVITFTTPLRQAYKSTWTHFNGGSGSAPDLGGPATLYALSQNWNATFVFNNLTFVQTLQTGFSGKSMTLNGCTFVGGGPFPTNCQTFVMNDCFCSTCTMEVDKLVGTITISNTPFNVIQVQSASVDSLVIRNSTIQYLLGTPKNVTIENSTIAVDTRFGPGMFGCGQSCRVIDSSITLVTASQNFIAVGDLSYDGFGTFSKLKNALLTATSAKPFPWAPGHKAAFVYYGGSINKTPDGGGGEVYFRVMNIRDDGTYLYMDTDLRGPLPTPTFNGGANTTNYYWAYPYESVVQTGGSGTDLTTLMAPTTVPTSTWTINS